MSLLGRIGAAAAAFSSLQRPLWKRRDISKGTKLKMYRALVLTVLLYAGETWPLTRLLENKLDVFDSRRLRRLLGIKWFCGTWCFGDVPSF